MRIQRLTLHNFVCFNGTQEITLDGKVYAVVARRADNPDSSNWTGKSTFLESVDFVLYGVHRYPKEDDWITRGQPDGFVELETDDGIIIRRERTRGKSTQVIVTDKGAKLKKAEAEARIVQLVGLDKADFRATSYFAQRQMSKFVTADPGDRMAIIAAWLRLEPIKACEKRARDLVRTHLDDVARIQSEVEGKRSFIRQTLESANIKPTTLQVFLEAGEVIPFSMITCMRHEESDLEAEIRVQDGKVKELGDTLESHLVHVHAWSADVAAMTEFDRLAVLGKETKAKLDGLKEKLNLLPTIVPGAIDALKEERESLSKASAECYAELSAAATEKRQKKALAQGEFDGLCPVAGIACPAKDEINAPRKRNLKLYDAASSAHETLQKKHDGLQIAYAQASRQVQALQTQSYEEQTLAKEIETLGAGLVDLRARCEKLAVASKRARDGVAPAQATEMRAALETAKARLLELTTSRLYLTRAQQGICKAIEELRLLDERLTAAVKEAAVYREAVQIFGRNGAQKRVAEGALSEIEGNANGLLQTCGIDLTIAVQWAREGGGLATECDACGTPFPTSQRVKECSRCQAERGPKVINKLDIVLSDRSGAAEDLAGISFQLAASAWLRNARGSAWGTALIDEPFTALDTANRKALANHFATMLKGAYGYEQSFIVAHQKEVMEALPARIEIFADGTGSKLRVVG